MILVTIGTQLAFPRLIAAMDALAPTLGEPVVAQVGPDTEVRQYIETHSHLPPDEFDALFGDARVVVAHAGVGTILMAKRMQRPLIIVPRRYAMGEHRNDHQIATAREAIGITGVRVAWEIDDLPGLLQVANPTPAEPTLSPRAETLITHLRDFIG